MTHLKTLIFVVQGKNSNIRGTQYIPQMYICTSKEHQRTTNTILTLYLFGNPSPISLILVNLDNSPT